MKRRKAPKLPRLTMLSVSKSELLRFHLAMEQLSSLVLDLASHVQSLKEGQKRSEAAKKANQTRKAQRVAGSEIEAPEANGAIDRYLEKVVREVIDENWTGE